MIRQTRCYKSNLFYIFLLLFTSVLCSCANSKGKHSATDGSRNEAEKLIDVDSSTFVDFKTDIASIYQDSKGNFWIGSHAEGVAKWDGKGYTYYNQDQGLVDNQVRSIQEDLLGNIWIATAKGISVYDGSSFKERVRMNAWNENTYPPQRWSSAKHDLWFHAGEKFGVYRFDGEEITYMPFPVSNLDDDDDSTYQNTCYAKGRGGQLWFGTYPAVFGYDGQNMSTIDSESIGMAEGEGYMHVRSIYEDSRGHLWIGNNGLGLLLYDGEKFVNFTKKHNLNTLQYKASNIMSDSPGTLARVFSIGEDNNGHMWFGTADAGVWKYDGTDLVNYTVEDGLKTPFIKAIYRDPQGKMYFGSGNNVYTYASEGGFVQVF